MRMVLRTLWLAAALLIAAPGAVSPAQACSCMQPTPEGSLLNARVVFEGHVLEVRPVQLPDGASRVEVKLRVVRAFKNVGHEHVTVWTPSDSAACGYAFQVGESHLVYAGGEAEPYEVNLCNGTQPMAGAGAFLAHLGMGVVPVDPPVTPAKPADKPEPPARGGCASCSVGSPTPAPLGGAGWAVLALVGLGLTTWRRRRS